GAAYCDPQESKPCEVFTHVLNPLLSLLFIKNVHPPSFATRAWGRALVTTILLALGKELIAFVITIVVEYAPPSKECGGHEQIRCCTKKKHLNSTKASTTLQIILTLFTTA